MTQQAVAQLFGIYPSRLVALADELEDKKLITRKGDAADRRKYHLHLTSAGRRCLQRIAEVTHQLEEDLFGTLDSTERETMAEVLRRIVSQQGITPAVHPAYREQQETSLATRKEKNRE